MLEGIIKVHIKIQIQISKGFTLREKSQLKWLVMKLLLFNDLTYTAGLLHCNQFSIEQKTLLS